eukprot:CAMPEP_0168497120 /NCGR_PEP_ID=MMETSP0228-20121227/72606_1 /TAXON_ID=133427 /ORGANISM="Protoceratium reticulatum, Strain CCCM 535 (=CCMP 1889)" /LENGTH=182 /DNA_ID=CAMNT_0008513995 /DNA_START=26 /DNA_END=570 /DNA_ORIENTATION=+
MPHGLLRDLAGNDLPANSSLGHFTVLSGTVSSAVDAYNGSSLGLELQSRDQPSQSQAEDEEESGPADVEAPFFVSMYPPVDATDVPVEGANFVLFYSENVTVNTSSTSRIRFLKGGGIAYTVEWSSIFLVHHGLWFDIRDDTAGFFEDGQIYRVFVPANVVVDTAGNSAPSIQLPFRCLIRG